MAHRPSSPATKEPSPGVASDVTRERLIEAAGEVFAERGFRAATVRDICKRAGANVAAIHYHFGDKEALYATVLQVSLRAALDKYPPLMGAPAGARAPERLHAFVRSLLFRILDEGRPAWHGQLMLREMVEPSAALDELVDRGIRPLFELLQSIVRDLFREAGPAGRAPAKLVAQCVASVIGQCVFYKHTKPVYARLMPGQRYDSASIEDLADHITQFSIAAIAGSAPERIKSAASRATAKRGPK